MNKAKIFTILMVSLLAVVLISEFASAAEPFKIVSAKWLPSGKQNETITFGDSIDLSVSVPYNLRMAGCYLMKSRVSVTLYEKDSRQVVYSFLNEKLLTREEINKGFFATYHLDQSVYDNPGQYYAEVYKTESWLLCWYGVQDVKGLLTYRAYLDVEQAEEPEPVIPIQITSCPVTQINESLKYSYQVISTPKNGGTLLYELIESPDWLSMNKKTGVVGGQAPEVDSNTNYPITIKVSERQCIYDAANICGGYRTITSSTQHYLLTVKDTSVTPEPIDYYSCQQDNDCVKAQAGCCDCNNGGTLVAINKMYTSEWMSWLLSKCTNACPSVISNHWTCTNSEAKCLVGKCVLVPKNITPICGDGVCETGETCPVDCEEPEPICGDGICEAGENCPADCEIPPQPVCGNKICETGESITCPLDCINPRPECGDGICEAGENCDPDCRPEDDDDDNENDYLYKDVYETKYLQEEAGRSAGKTIILLEPEALKAKKSCWQRFLEWLASLF